MSAPETKFESKLESAPSRFLAHVIEHALAIGRRTPEDFIRHFSAAQIMSGLELRPNLRADILEPTTGTRRKIALRKSAKSAGEDLQIAMDEGEATAEQVVEIFRPDDRVKYLDSKALWAFVTEGEFWQVDAKTGEAFAQAKRHIAFILDRALLDGLVSHGDLIEGVSVASLAESLPRETLAAIITAALERGRKGAAFTDEDLLETAAAQVLVEDVSLGHIWETVVLPKIARAHNLVDTPTDALQQASARGNKGEDDSTEVRTVRDTWSVPEGTPALAPAPTPAVAPAPAPKGGTPTSALGKSPPKVGAATAKKPAAKAKANAKGPRSKPKTSEPKAAGEAQDLHELYEAFEEVEVEVEDFDIEEEEIESSVPR